MSKSIRIKTGFLLRELGGVSIVVAIGDAARQFGGIARLNASAACLFKLMQAGCTRDDLANALVERYGIAFERAVRDVDALLVKLAPMLEP